MKLLGVLFIVIGAWFLASAMTEHGLLPSGHGTGRISEVVEGLVLIGYGVFRLRKRKI